MCKRGGEKEAIVDLLLYSGPIVLLAIAGLCYLLDFALLLAGWVGRDR